jgi:hypothetical protein
VPSQKLIDPFQASGPDLKTRTGAASSSESNPQRERLRSNGFEPRISP